MNGVIGMTGLLLGTKLSPEQRRYAELARGSAESLLTVINDILDFSKIEAGKLGLEMVGFDLQVLLDEVSDIMKPQAEERRLSFSCSKSSDAPTLLRGDPGRVRQVLVNLISNAMKFTTEGEVAIITSLERETGHGVLLRFSVRDTGIGIPDDKQLSIFDHFTQIETSFTRRFSGTGLGLAISKQLAELMGGEIGVRSAVGVGSEFWFTARFDKVPAGESILGSVPVREDNGPPSNKPLPASHPLRNLERPEVRVLLAEDNATNRLVAMGILGKLGLRADSVNNGREAITALQRVAYDIVLMDVQMPELDGLEATRAIRAGRDKTLNRNVPIIAMTAHAMKGARETCLDAGMNDYLAKPVTPAALSQMLEKWFTQLDEARKTGSPLGSVGASSPNDAKPAEETRPRVFAEAALVDRLMGDRELARVVVVGFLDDMPHQFDALRGYVAVGDAKAAGRQAHTIKGAAATVSAEELSTLAFALERAGKAGDLESIQIALGELEGQFQRLKRTMQSSALLRETPEKGR
jgi:CheY-like chemotaxis protein/HPt (histidine-containing phosphotransfer) domain-containing protein